jgi:hypothetical protein
MTNFSVRSFSIACRKANADPEPQAEKEFDWGEKVVGSVSSYVRSETVNFLINI